MPDGLPALTIHQFRSLRQGSAAHEDADGLDVGIKVQLSEDNNAEAVFVRNDRRSMAETSFSRLGGQHHDDLAIWLLADITPRTMSGIQSPGFTDRTGSSEPRGHDNHHRCHTPDHFGDWLSYFHWLLSLG